ncbi:hypothetical protein [Streptacidiphilus carbonis]|uniref:hypothetical protein n=1 Tax=Streptacidiphilus carbonis TaxID=105422 RepID=UPI000B1A1EBC|nr:hypothetical protein [Streptacidiphilus carbonis]
MNISISDRFTKKTVSAEEKAQADAEALKSLKPLPVWFFGFEGLMGAAYDVIKTNPDAWMVLAGLGAVNMVVGITVLGKRRKLVRAMLKNSRTRAIAIGLIALRVGAHVVLGLAGAQITSPAGHLAMAFVMTALTVTLLWFDQRVSFKALGLLPTGTAPAAAPASAQA